MPQLSHQQANRHLPQPGSSRGRLLPHLTPTHRDSLSYCSFAENVFLFAIMLKHEPGKKQKHPHLSAESPE